MGFVTPDEIDKALSEQKDGKSKKRLGEILVEAKSCDGEQVAKALAHQANLKYAQLSKFEIPPEVIELVPKDLAIKQNIVPLKKGKRALIIATPNPLDFIALDDLRFQLGQEVECVLASTDGITEALGKYYGGIATDLESKFAEITASAIEVKTGDIADLESIEDGDDAPIIKLVNQIIANAVSQRASDVHVEPMEKKVRIRYRIDGDCVEKEPLPKKLQGPVIARLKIMSKMKPDEKRVPQDGRIKLNIAGREIDFRVNALPATHGESVVLRILDKEKALVDLEQLGLHKSDFDKFERTIKRPNGVMLVTGPTGSGKTTTLYSALKKLNKPDVKIITAENPVEYNIAGINQAEVLFDIGRTFQIILKAMLRQAPNIILVGEIRDEETATIAIQAALTGHLVFSTLHTNDACSSISRLTDMGVKNFLVASAILAILAQRLLRKLCTKCKEPLADDQVPQGMLAAVGMKPEQVRGKPLHQKGEGCDNCNRTGYRGRMGCYEFMEMTPQLREGAFNAIPQDELKKLAVQGGMATLQVDGCRKVLDGITTFEEVLTITHRLDLKQ
ncbi:Flp pilus assembly complex ATPase component TadA [bacterium]|nr:Flp pilus assembly complex ATPase component TadA [bacterium]